MSQGVTLRQAALRRGRAPSRRSRHNGKVETRRSVGLYRRHLRRGRRKMSMGWARRKRESVDMNTESKHTTERR